MASRATRTGTTNGADSGISVPMSATAPSGSSSVRMDMKKAPKEFSLPNLLYNVLIKHDYRSLGVLQHNSLFIGMMHFQDLYNYDINRVKRCCIHYAMTDGRIIPFCAFNVIPEWYRDKSQAEQGVSFEEWEKKTGRSMRADAYKRDVKALTDSGLYKDTYG